jgi:alpha-1,2-mannosyltransferase
MTAARVASAYRNGIRMLRDAPWLTPARVRAYAVVLVASYVAVFAWFLSGSGDRDPLGRPVGTDFASFWTVSRAVLDGRVGVVYSPSEFMALQAAVTGSDAWYAWFYPPVTVLMVAPLAMLRYVPSFLVWSTVSLAAYLAVLHAVFPRRLTVLAGAAFPAVFLALGHGQTSLLVTTALIGGLVLLEASPIAAGALLGALVVKPQLTLLVPLALVAGRRWRALAAAAASSAALVAASLACFGPSMWRAFVRVTPIAREVLERGGVAHHKFQSTFAAVRLLGGGVGAAYALQVAVTVLAAAAVAVTWRSQVPQRIRSAVLVSAGALATPFVLDYDLVLLGPAIAWLVADAQERGWRGWEKTALAAAAVVPILSRPFALVTGVLLGPLVVAALVAVLTARARAVISRGAGRSITAVRSPAA